jgi:hypothetical protein
MAVVCPNRLEALRAEIEGFKAEAALGDGSSQAGKAA